LAAAGYTGGLSPGRTLWPVNGTSAGYAAEVDGLADTETELAEDGGAEDTGDRLGVALPREQATSSRVTGRPRANALK